MGKTGKFLTAFSEQTAPGRQKCRTMLNASGLSASPVDERIQGEADNPEAFSMVLHFCRPGAVCSEKAVRNLPVFPMIHKPSRTQQTCMFGKVTTPERRPFAAAAWGLILKTPI